MPKNVGPEDRIVRVVFGIIIAVLIAVGVVEDLGAIIGGIIAAYLIVSGLASRCIFYKMVDVDTTVQEQSYSTTDDRSGL